MRRPLLAGALGLAGIGALSRARRAPRPAGARRRGRAGAHVGDASTSARTASAATAASAPPSGSVGTTVDAQEGAVRLIVASDDAGGTSRAVFSEGKFRSPRRGGDP